MTAPLILITAVVALVVAGGGFALGALFVGVHVIAAMILVAADRVGFWLWGL